jgi:glycoprotein endo-alpha-1,2-mannosidase
MWQAALTGTNKPAIITITSFNEWHEGTQIENAVPHKSTSTGFQYADYQPNASDYYLELTRKWIARFNTEIIE